ncbi:MAG: ribosome small subunit-dependent GTPase A [Flavobacteriia bacterium]|nr:ribosome small subunit-dependent GTPase A [Flavobacteriia bacterium]
MLGKVLKSTSNRYLVELGNKTIITARLRGKIRLEELKTTNPIAVGDNVELSKDKDEEGIHTILNILKRKNYIIRKSTNLSKQKQIIAANVDLAILVYTLKEPFTHQLFIDRFLVSLESFRIPTIILFNKMDIYNEVEKKEIEILSAVYQNIGYHCYQYSMFHQDNKNEIISLMKNKQVVLAGNSGVGKSTFISSLDTAINLKKGNISVANKQGKHTTTFAEMYHLSIDSYVIDTPGIRAFGLVELDKENFAHYFPEMRNVLGKCKYYNCLHINEPECAVKKAVDLDIINSSRYQNYLQMMNEEEEDTHRKNKFS